MADKGFGVREMNLIGGSGTPEIESPNNLNINATNVAISTNMSVGGTVTVGTAFIEQNSVGVGTTTGAGRDAGISTAVGTLTYIDSIGLQVYTGDNAGWRTIADTEDTGAGMNIALSSSSFTNTQAIPTDHKAAINGCTESNNSVQISWTVTGTNANVASLRLECWDTNAQGTSRSGNFVHWEIAGINPAEGSYSLAENATWQVSDGIGGVAPTSGGTDYGFGDRNNGWNGPCPPSGTHTYNIEIYPVDANGNEVTANVTTTTLSFTST